MARGSDEVRASLPIDEHDTVMHRFSRRPISLSKVGVVLLAVRLALAISDRMILSGRNTRLEGPHCFLCEPSRDLVFFACDDFFALAGLGPVVDGYSVLAAKTHLKSMADMPSQLAQKRDAVVQVLRVCPETSGGITKFSEHEADGVKPQHRQ